MVEDHLDKEISVSADLTPTGVKASAKSRFVAALDRLGGNVLELLNAPIEVKSAEKRAVAEGRVRAISAITELGIERLKTDPEFAERAMRTHLGSVFTRQENKDAVLEKAIEDLRRQPPTDQQAASGAERLDDGFMNRFERYAEEASADEVRERWGRVLAAEIRKPSTFSGKVLRIIDELDPATAQLFERVCASRLQNVLPKCLVGELNFQEISQLSAAGLLIDPGIAGHIRRSSEITDNKGVALWFWGFEPFGLAITRQEDMRKIQTGEVFQDDGGKPAISVYILTDVGFAISSILPDNAALALDALFAKVSEASKSSEARLYFHPPKTSQWLKVSSIPPREPAA